RRRGEGRGRRSAAARRRGQGARGAGGAGGPSVRAGSLMRAAVFHGPGRPLVVETIDDPTPGELQVVVKVGRCGVCGTDLHMTEEHGGKALMPTGAVPGHEFAGEIVALGRGV